MIIINNYRMVRVRNSARGRYKYASYIYETPIFIDDNVCFFSPFSYRRRDLVGSYTVQLNGNKSHALDWSFCTLLRILYYIGALHTTAKLHGV